VVQRVRRDRQPPPIDVFVQSERSGFGRSATSMTKVARLLRDPGPRGRINQSSRCELIFVQKAAKPISSTRGPWSGPREVARARRSGLEHLGPTQALIDLSGESALFGSKAHRLTAPANERRVGCPGRSLTTPTIGITPTRSASAPAVQRLSPGRS
jgi:hypothetical protein